ncbi:unnamed protein product [Schistosoma intercalatum]|uniref:PCI domain-containing protein n=1 Tax=Schistosoma mattheei TaxID=31246 RepID=A0AA85B931_9TREM|nr:unnamed protein product [Schistosoma mattheei]CAH8459068.1 unnamed protein product [Schistosoma intercalatum]CAH8459475.1 unnamed protein product [Schistosoma intercalatum]
MPLFSRGLFVFGEFLDHPKIKSIENGEYSQYYNLMNLFCYGTFELLSTNRSAYPDLRPTQVRKLKQLSIIDEAHNQKHIPYGLLFKKLDIASSRELEDLVIELFYLEAITGKLDQQKALLEVNSAIGRDIRIEQIDELHQKLDSWGVRVESVLAHIANEIKMVNERRYESELHQKEILEASLSIKEALRGQMAKSDAQSLRMDMDDILIHPDLLESRVEATRQSSSNTESVGDRDVRSRITVFKNLRHGKSSKQQ